MYTIDPSELKKLLLIILCSAFALYLVLIFFGFINRSVRTLHIAFIIASFMAFIAPNIFLLDGVMGKHSWNPSILLCYISVIAIIIPFFLWTRIQSKR